jgi:hypothetical protein
MCRLVARGGLSLDNGSAFGETGPASIRGRVLVAGSTNTRRRSAAQLAADGFASLVEKLGAAEAVQYVQLDYFGRGRLTPQWGAFARPVLVKLGSDRYDYGLIRPEDGQLRAGGAWPVGHSKPVLTEVKMSNRWLYLAFAAVGLVAGVLSGLSASSVVSALLGLVFAFFGGSVITVLHKLTAAQQQVAAKCLFCLCLLCLAGVLGGIAISEWQLLSPSGIRHGGERKTVEQRKYLKETLATDAATIDNDLRQGNINGAEAYKRLREAIRKAETDWGPAAAGP